MRRGAGKALATLDAGQINARQQHGQFAGVQRPKRVSALDAAAQVLKSAGKPMRAQELIAAMAELGLWSSPGGATPHATLYAAMAREISVKGDASRFTKTDRGQFAFNKAGER